MGQDGGWSKPTQIICWPFFWKAKCFAKKKKRASASKWVFGCIQKCFAWISRNQVKGSFSSVKSHCAAGLKQSGGAVTCLTSRAQCLCWPIHQTNQNPLSSLNATPSLSLSGQLAWSRVASGDNDLYAEFSSSLTHWSQSDDVHNNKLMMPIQKTERPAELKARPKGGLWHVATLARDGPVCSPRVAFEKVTALSAERSLSQRTAVHRLPVTTDMPVSLKGGYVGWQEVWLFRAQMCHCSPPPQTSAPQVAM